MVNFRAFSRPAGPMVYGCAVYPIASQKEMASLGFADSKQLTEKKRDEIFEKMREMPERIYWITHVLSPNQISNAMLKRWVRWLLGRGASEGRADT